MELINLKVILLTLSFGLLINGYTVSISTRRENFEGKPIIFETKCVDSCDNIIGFRYECPKGYGTSVIDDEALVVENTTYDFYGKNSINVYSLIPKIIEITFQNSSKLNYPIQASTINPMILDIPPPSTIGGNYIIGKTMYMQMVDQLFIENLGSKSIVKFDINKFDYSKVSITFPAGAGKYSILLENQKLISGSYQPPTIQSITQIQPNIIIQGNNFFNSPLDSITNIHIGNQLLSNKQIVSIDHNKIVLNYPNNFSFKSDLKLSIQGQETNSTFEIKPIITDINSVPYKGGVVTIKGQYLNTISKDGWKASVIIKIQDYVCSNPRNPPNDKNFQIILCDMPKSERDIINLPVSIEIDSIKNENPIYFTYGIPQIYSHSQNKTRISITGENLDGNVKFYFNNQEVSPFGLNSENTTLFLELDPKAYNGILYCIVDRGRSNNYTLVLQPTISDISKGETRESVITISGPFIHNRHFNNTPILVSIKNTLGIEICTDIKELPPQSSSKYPQLTCKMQKGVGKNINISLSMDDKITYGNYSYQPPLITSILQQFGVAIVKGKNFGDSIGLTNLFYFNETIHPTILSFDRIEFEIPPLATEGKVIIQVFDQYYRFANVFKPLPCISNISTIKTNGGNISINGNFLNSTNISVSVGEYVCQNIVSTDPTKNRGIVCELPSGGGRNKTINITINGETVNNPNNLQFSFLPPRILNCTTVGEEGGFITITGESMINPVSVTIGSKDCLYPNVTTFDTVTCLLEPWDGSNEKQQIKVNCSGLIAIDNNIFAYNVTASDDEYNQRQQKLKWLIPAILIPCLIGFVMVAVITIILLKRQHKRRTLKKIINNNDPPEIIINNTQ
ncbi:hypothetical protein CYY_006367 [Polysphondylium violaceum]|uniref:IPT/TIG domain-containing protein n=1 Tax=Polysphondylium violaceum TaxID=133409 RepID=A0A8J4PR53_9MYCE|nr:hypothetical protein CYY_006367 [Polysphondylium violaceum]